MNSYEKNFEGIGSWNKIYKYFCYTGSIIKIAIRFYEQQGIRRNMINFEGKYAIQKSPLYNISVLERILLKKEKKY